VRKSKRRFTSEMPPERGGCAGARTCDPRTWIPVCEM